jgi:ubiquinone/menaquinone biosynthesis C-methylase UbiE
MNTPPTTRLKPDYGIDAPGLVRAFFGAGAVGLALAVATAFVPWPGPPWGFVITGAFAAVAVYATGMGLLMVYWSRIVKVRGRERLLDLVNWRGDEAVLDVGCGRGLMLVGVAHRVPNGGAVGVDVWSARDQNDNRPEAAVENARREGVADRVTVATADARALPCKDESFDAVVSHWVIHNIEPAADRERAIREMVRVLKPGGVLLVADIHHLAEYRALLTALGLTDLRCVGAGWLGRTAAVLSMNSFHPRALVARKSATVASDAARP